MTDCIFCKIAKGDIPTELVYQSQQVVAFNDLNPQAPIHVLIIPKRHIATLNDFDGADPADVALAGELVMAAKQIASELGVDEKGYRLVMNCNSDGGQSVYHIHAHLLAGRQLSWPPG